MDVAPTRDLIHAGRRRSDRNARQLENWGEVKEPEGRVTDATCLAVERQRREER